MLRDKGSRRKGSGNPLDEKFWPLIKDKYDAGMEMRRPYEERWIINLSFIGGRQYVIYNQSAQMLQHLVQRKGRLRIVDNKIMPRFQKQVARLIRNNPRMGVVPASNEQEDLKAAKVGDKVLKAWWQSRGMKKRLRELAGWIYGTGNAFMDDRWDPKLGPVRFDGDTARMVYEGDADCSVWSPFEIIVPAGGLGDVDLHSFPWMMKAKYRPLEWFRGLYPRGSEVVSETKPMPFVDTSVLVGVAGTARTGWQHQEGAVECQLYLKPTPEWPKGLYAIAANGVVLGVSDYPFDHYHLEQFKDVEVPGVFWGMATTEAAIWLQKIWNRTLSDIAEYNRVMARGKWLIPRNSNMETLPDDSHGQRLLYTPVLGFKPEMLDVKGLPDTYARVLEIVMGSFMELYHQHEVTQGTNRSDIRSGDMVSLLLEQDDAGNIPTHAVFEESLEAVMNRVLRRIHKGYTSERTLSIVGATNEIEVFRFKGADLRNNTDVRVARESSLPDSKAVRQARIKENYKDGLYGDPADENVRERVLRMLEEVPDELEDMFKESHLDRQIARTESEMMAKNPDVLYLVNSYDNHSVHVEEHRMFRKQPEYQRLKMTDPRMFMTLEASFMKHEAMHFGFIKEEQEQMMAAQAAMKGGAE